LSLRSAGPVDCRADAVLRKRAFAFTIPSVPTENPPSVDDQSAPVKITGEPAAVLPRIPKLIAFFAVAGVMGVSLMYGPEGRAFDFGDMMNPGKWMGGGHDRYDDDYGGPWGGGPYGAGGPLGGPYGGGGPWGGYGPGPYRGGPYAPPGYYGAPGRPGGATVPAPAAPAPAAKAPASNNSKIEALQRRIEELESQRQKPAAPPPSSGDWSSPPPSSGDWAAPPPSRDWGPPRSSGDSGKPSPNDWGSAPAFRPLGKN
jgi:hypothetical protein